MKEKMEKDSCEKIFCKICGKETSELRSVKVKEKYHKCSACGYIFMDYSSYASFDEERERYLEHNNSYENEGYRTFLEAFLKKGVLPYGSNFQKALDFGSGPEPVLARIMREKHGINTDIYDLHFSPRRVYLNRKYDLIVSTEVLEHLKDPVAVLREISDCLMTGGMLSVMTLFHHQDDARFFNWHYRRDKTHIGFFTAKALELAGKSVGLELIYTDGERIATFKK